MRRIEILWVAILCLTALLGVGAHAGYEPVYWEKLGEGESWITGVNNKGAIVGCSIDVRGHQRAFFWTEERGILDLGTLGGDNSVALDINDDGEIVGFSDLADGSRHAFLRTTEGGMVDLDVLSGDSASEATSVADLVVGWSGAKEGRSRAFSWSVDTGELTQLAELAPGADAQAFGINARNMIVGMARDSKGNPQAVCWGADGGNSIQAVGTLGGPTSSAYGVNDAGLVVGEASDASRRLHAFCRLRDSSMHQLPLPRSMSGARATSINASNQIVGYAVGKAKRALVWDIGSNPTDRMPAKVAFLPLLKGTTGSEATAISDSGVVVGYCVTPDGHKRAVLWRPTKDKDRVSRGSIAFVGGLFSPTGVATRDRFAKTWFRMALKPFDKEKNTIPHFSADGGAYRFNGPESVRLYQLSFGLEKGLSRGAFAQSYVALRGGPYYGTLEEVATGSRQTKLGLNLNLSYGVIFLRGVYAEARYDFFSRFADVNFSGLSLSVGFRLFDIPL